MRTTQFDKTPLIGQAKSMFVGATNYKNFFSMLHLIPIWFKMVHMMKQIPGYCRHFVWYDFPFTLGTIAFFTDQDSMMKFARSRYHRELMIWVTDGSKNATAGFIRLYDVQPHGYSNGTWRSEENTMKHIERFTPLSFEKEGPKVNPNAT